jgi:hypothetical protein
MNERSSTIPTLAAFGNYNFTIILFLTYVDSLNSRRAGGTKKYLLARFWLLYVEIKCSLISISVYHMLDSLSQTSFSPVLSKSAPAPKEVRLASVEDLEGCFGHVQGRAVERVEGRKVYVVIA